MCIKMKKVWIYSRIANAENLDDAYLTGQEKALKELAEQHCFNVVGYSRDISSGLNLNRKGLKEIENAISVNTIDAVLVKDMSRIGRNTFEVLSLLRDWKEQGIELLTAGEL